MSEDRLDRLERAFDAYLEWASADSALEREEFLGRHATVRDLLEPMLTDAPAPDENARSERMLGDFALVREIGRGGMGVVYEARQLSLRRRVALKLLAPSFSFSPRAIARFRREAEIMGRLDHPGLVKVFAVGQLGESFYYAMELVNGRPLDEVVAAVRDRPFDRLTGDDLLRGADGSEQTSPFWQRGYVQVAVELVQQVAAALDHAHRAGVVHRDVKPANILVRGDGTAVLTDFGLARQDDLPTVTRSGEFAGTPSYVSPEQARGQQVDARADVFSLGATLYELLTHRCPFEGDTAHEVLQRIQTKEPPHPARLHPGLAPDLVAIVLRALEKDPRNRYRTAGELAADLNAFLDYRPVSARRISTGTRVLRWARREPLRAALVLAIALGVPLVTGLGGYLLANADNIRAGSASRLRTEIDRTLAAGFVQLATGDSERARRLFDGALQLDGDQVEALVGAVLARTLNGRHADGLALLDQRPEVIAGSKALRLLRTVIARGLAGADPAVAPADAHEALELFVVGTEKLSAGGEVRNATLIREATRCFELAVTRTPRARMLYHIYWLQAARQCWDKDTATAAADAMEQLWPGHPQVQLSLGYALNDLDPPRAIAALEAVLARDDDTDPDAVSSDDRWSARVHLANAYHEVRRYDDAKVLLEQLLAERPEFVKAHVNLALVYQDLGRLEDAEASYRRSVEIDPGYAWGWFALGRFFKAQRRDEEAIGAFQRCAELQPKMPACRFNLAFCLKRSGQVDEALAQYREAVALDPSLFAAWQNMGNILKARSEFAAAEAAYRSAAEANPGDSDIQVSLGDTCRRQGHLADAIAAFRRAVEFDPEHVKAREHLAAALALLESPGRDD